MVLEGTAMSRLQAEVDRGGRLKVWTNIIHMVHTSGHPLCMFNEFSHLPSCLSFVQICMWANGARELAAAWKLPRLGICMQLIEVCLCVHPVVLRGAPFLPFYLAPLVRHTKTYVAALDLRCCASAARWWRIWDEAARCSSWADSCCRWVWRGLDPDIYGSGSGGCAMQFLGRQLLQVCMDSRVIGW